MNFYRTAIKLFKKFNALAAKPKYTVNLTVTGNGHVTLNGAEASSIIVKEGMPLTVIATPDEGQFIKKAVYTMGNTTRQFSNAVTIDEVTADVTVSVEFGERAIILPTSITISPATLTIAPGDEAQLFVTFNPADSYSDLSWRSDNGDIVSVDEQGVIKGLSDGQTTVTVETTNGIKADCIVRVYDGSTRIETIPNLATGQKWQARLLADNVPVSSGVTWTSSNQNQIAITPEGLVTVVYMPQGLERVETTLTAKYDGVEYQYEYATYLRSSGYSFSSGEFEYYLADDNNVDAGFSVSLNLEYDFSTTVTLIIPEEAVDEFGYSYTVSAANINIDDDYPVAEILLPATIRKVEKMQAYGVEILVCLAGKVPETDSYINLKNGANIYVPADAVNDYRANQYWNQDGKDYLVKAVGNDAEYKYTVYFVPSEMPISSAPYCYIWDNSDGKVYAGNWPGSMMTYTEVADMYVWAYTCISDVEIKEPMVIFNWNQYQTPDMALENNGIYTWNGLVGNTGIDNINADSAQEIDYSAPYEVYNLYGQKVSVAVDNLENGMYIIRQGNKVTKILVK